MTYISNDILIGFLKKYNVHKLVLSSGTRNIPFVSSVEVDKWFECFSVVDERNAALHNSQMSRLLLHVQVGQQFLIMLQA